MAEELETHRQMAKDRAVERRRCPVRGLRSQPPSDGQRHARPRRCARGMDCAVARKRLAGSALRLASFARAPGVHDHDRGDVAAGDGAEYQLLHPVQRDGAPDLASAGRRASRHRSIEIGRARRRGRRVDVRLRVHAETGAHVRRIVCDSRRRQPHSDDVRGDRRFHLRAVRVRERELLRGSAHTDGDRARVRARGRPDRPAGIGRHHRRRPVAAGVRRRSQRARPHHLREPAASDHRRRHGRERQRHVALHQ